jgi:uncharacterized sporulation protein YeaH/YhbH (DUF444 family)
MRTGPLNAVLRAALTARRERSVGEYVFARADGKPYKSGAARCISNLHAEMRRAVRLFGPLHVTRRPDNRGHAGTRRNENGRVDRLD